MKLYTTLITLFFIMSFSVFSKETLKNFELRVYGEKQTISLEKIKADKVVINFFASWCVACLKEVPELNKLKEDAPSDQDIVFLAINANEKDFKIMKFIKKTNFSYTVLKDKGLDYSLSIGVEELPRTIVLDSKKRIIYSSSIPPSKL